MKLGIRKLDGLMQAGGEWNTGVSENLGRQEKKDFVHESAEFGDQ